MRADRSTTWPPGKVLAKDRILKEGEPRIFSVVHQFHSLSSLQSVAVTATYEEHGGTTPQMRTVQLTIVLSGGVSFKADVTLPAENIGSVLTFAKQLLAARK